MIPEIQRVARDVHSENNISKMLQEYELRLYF